MGDVSLMSLTMTATCVVLLLSRVPSESSRVKRRSNAGVDMDIDMDGHRANASC
jgi:hypothetical protein